MEGLSWLFFCLSPFALFCSESGNGLILCPTFIVLGFVFKWIENRLRQPPTAVIKIPPNEFWAWHYKQRVSELGDNREMEARDWATYVARANNCWVPSEAQQEEIARAAGITTQKVRQQKENDIDRIQLAKKYAMRLLAKQFEDGEYEVKNFKAKHALSDYEFQRDIKERSGDIAWADGDRAGYISPFDLRKKLGVDTIEELWNKILTKKEKDNAIEWAKNAIEILAQERNAREEFGKYPIRSEEHEIEHGYIIKSDDLI